MQARGVENIVLNPYYSEVKKCSRNVARRGKEPRVTKLTVKR